MTMTSATPLAEEQAGLVAALVQGADAPPGFDVDRLRAAAAALTRKRARAAARAWPGLAAALGGAFAVRFASFAATTSLPALGGPLADGRRFARWLAHRTELPSEGQLEALAVDLRFVATPQGLRPRRGPVLKAAWLRDRRRLAVAVRLPWLGVHWLTIPIGRGSRRQV